VSRETSTALLMGIGINATLRFTAAALAELPKPVDVSACVDAAYYEGNPNTGDFDQWAIAMQLVGFERLYVPNQPYYHKQYAASAKAKRGFIMFGFDVVHRYAYNTQLQSGAPTSFKEVVESLNVDVGACLHEHWYDNWVFLSMSTDEYFSFLHQDPKMLPKAPTRPVPLVGEYLSRFVTALTKPGRVDRMPLDALGRRWQCPPAACFPTRRYNTKPDANTERYGYEAPHLNASARSHKRLGMMQFNASDPAKSRLSFEDRIYRGTEKEPHGASRKCAYHPDWRTSATKISIHGMLPDGCPWNSWLTRSLSCDGEARPEYRPLCWELCARFDGKHSMRQPRVRPEASSANNTCLVHNGRYETSWNELYRGAPSEHIPACPKGSTQCNTSVLLERAHMRGQGNSSKTADWLLGMATAIKTELAAVMGEGKQGTWGPEPT